MEMSDGLHTDSGYTVIGIYKINGLQFKEKMYKHQRKLGRSDIHMHVR